MTTTPPRSIHVGTPSVVPENHNPSDDALSGTATVGDGRDIPDALAIV
jgi:hypothetical protein